MINILVATPEVFEHGKKTIKKKGGIKPVDNLICMELSSVSDIYSKLPKLLSTKRGVPCLIEFMDGVESNKDMLFELLEENKMKNQKNNI